MQVALGSFAAMAHEQLLIHDRILDQCLWILVSTEAGREGRLLPALPQVLVAFRRWYKLCSAKFAKWELGKWEQLRRMAQPEPCIQPL